MIAMQYVITLPSDYPMDTIKNRIETKGHLLNHYPGLKFKAYLYSEKNSQEYPCTVNRYAPFYVWQNHEAMVSFLKSDGFKALCDQFGRPVIKTWFIDHLSLEPTQEHELALINCSDNASDISATNYADWSNIGVSWLSGQTSLTNTPPDCIYKIGYIAR
ncbi:DUF4865 family protein [Vibrio viridaestus]|uniref:DUF4865 family protein n=1 Tax=Vibrio viridaestus TaxID=2487322 RepID=A0A3N9TER9_9VIBR|nr:DUF4865 family protein [Vibrio viridaestus]RQW62213.1 DUF4865 family protein [Vibrio viridaestus]